MEPKLAILSPNQNAYSETFIQAHKNLPFAVKFYYGGFLPASLEGKSMITLPWKLRFEKKFLKGFSNGEKKLMFSLKNENINAVLAEYGQTGAECLNVIQYLNLPLIVHFHGYDASVKNIVEGYKEKYRRMFNYASSVIAVSCKMKESLIQMGCPEEKIVLNPYGPDSDFFNCNPKYQSKILLAIGRFVEKKAAYLTIVAFSRLLNNHPDAKLRMVGDGSLLPVCRDLVQALGIQEKVTFLGVQSPEIVRKEMESALAFVQHSVTAEDGDSEGTPVAVLEAQAAALPVIATYHAGIPDVVIHNETGLLCEERDVDAMAKNMEQIIDNIGLAQRMGAAGRKRVRENFTMDKHLSKISRCIYQALNLQP